MSEIIDLGRAREDRKALAESKQIFKPVPIPNTVALQQEKIAAEMVKAQTEINSLLTSLTGILSAFDEAAAFLNKANPKIQAQNQIMQAGSIAIMQAAPEDRESVIAHVQAEFAKVK